MLVFISRVIVQIRKFARRMCYRWWVQVRDGSKQEKTGSAPTTRCGDGQTETDRPGPVRLRLFTATGNSLHCNMKRYFAKLHLSSESWTRASACRKDPTCHPMQLKNIITPLHNQHPPQRQLLPPQPPYYSPSALGQATNFIPFPGGRCHLG